MIVDAFSFNDEVDLLEVRLRELERVADWFILVEATETHSGQPKPLHYLRQRSDPRFQPFLDRIIHVVVDDLPGEDPANRAAYQRLQIARGLELFGELGDDDLLIVSDLDEIPRAVVIETIRDDEDLRRRRCALHLSSFRATPRCRTVGWHVGPRVFAAGPMPIASQLLSRGRPGDGEFPIPMAGWHFAAFLPAGQRPPTELLECRPAPPEHLAGRAFEMLDLPAFMLANLAAWDGGA